MKDYRHLVRAGILGLSVVAAFLVARKLMVPADFGKTGPYRAGALDEIAGEAPRYADAKACVKCHGKQSQARSANAHRGVSCQSCHGPLADHAASPRGKNPGKPAGGGTREFCGKCHYANQSRPRGFPQIDQASHNPGAACRECHDPHAPKL